MRAKTKEQRRTPPDLVDTPEDLAAGQIVDGEAIEDSRIAGGEFASQTLGQLLVRRSIVEGVSFAGANIRSVRLRDARFVHCDLSNAVMRGLEAARVEFVDCRLLGLKATECRMEDVLLERCDARYAQFNDGAMRRSEVTDTQFQEADLRGTNLEHTLWIRSNLSRADLSGARLAGADLRGATIDGIMAGIGDVEGAIVNAGQAMDLARLLGLIIR